MPRHLRVLAAAAGAFACGALVAAQTTSPKPAAQTLSAAPAFMADVTFRGSALTGWTPSGNVTWRAENGEIVGTPTSPSGGWLTWNQSYQDVATYAKFRCDGPCEAGILLRAQKSATGTTGVFVSLKDGDLNSYKLALDPAGNQTFEGAVHQRHVRHDAHRRRCGGCWRRRAGRWRSCRRCSSGPGGRSAA